MNPEAWRTLWSVLIVLACAALAWAALARVTQRTRRGYESLLSMASQPGASTGLLQSAQKKLTVLSLVANAARYAIVLVALLLVLDQVDVRVTGLLLPAGFVGAALGVGAQNVVRDVLAGLFFLFESQFAVGDAVSINGVSGTVEEIGVRVTRLRDSGGQEHFFPNGAVTTVSRYPLRSVPLLLRLPLLQGERADEVEAAVQSAQRAFASLFDRAASAPVRLHPAQSEAVAPEPPPQAAPVPEAPSDAAEAAAEPAPSPVGFAWWRWEAHPSRAALWREKFAPQVAAELRSAGLSDVAGEPEVLNAPVDS